MNRLKLLVYPLLMTAAIGLILFGAADRLDLPAFWIYLVTWLVFAGVALLTADEDLMRERRDPAGPSRDNLKLLRILAAVFIIAYLTIAGLDQRFGWTGPLPVAIQASGFILMIASIVFANWASRVNRFFSSAVRIQSDRGHTVVTSGPYRFVRHPGYVGFITLIVSGAIALGSLWSLIPAFLWTVLFTRRAALEDRMLREELDGYAAYAQKVRFRLVPHVW
jgi:protein-S-isoprenylcysteine O-methyltransferase Ste14